MIGTLLVLLGAAVVFWFFINWTKVKFYWVTRNVPHDKPHPLLGSLTFLQGKNPAVWMRDVYDRFQSPYVGVWLFWRPALIINSPEIARNVLIRDSANFRDRFLSSGQSDPIGALNLFTTNDPLWTALRRRLTSVFTAAKLRNIQPLVTAKCNELIHRIKNDMRSNKCINLRMTFSDFTSDVIGTAAFGVRCDATLTGESAIRRVTKDLMKYSVYRGWCWSSIFFFPELIDIFGFSLFPKRTTAYFRRIYRAIISERGGYDVEINDPKDLLDALRKMKREFDKENEELSEDTLIAQAAIFLLGGFDTTSNALTYCLYEVAHNSDVQMKLYNELMEAKRKMGNADFDASTLSELKYINCVIKETLRKYASMGWLDRIAAKDYKIDDKLTITAGTPVYVNAIGMHYDPDYFPDPKLFNPDRFLPESEKDIKPFTYIPFGEGPRICIGRRFALQNLLCALASLCVNFEVHPLPNAPLPDEVEIEKRGLFLMPEPDLYLRFVPRG